MNYKGVSRFPSASTTHLRGRFPSEQVDLFRFGDHVGGQRAHQVHLLPVVPGQDAGVMDKDVGIQRPVVPGFLWNRNIDRPATKQMMTSTMHTLCCVCTQNRDYANISRKNVVSNQSQLVLAEKY